MEANFFLDCGGHSLFAARVVSQLRSLPVLSRLGLADLYAHPTIRGLAALAAPVESANASAPAPVPAVPRRGPGLATIVQTAWLLGGLVLSGATIYLLLFELVPALTGGLSPVAFVLAAPLLYALGLCGYILGSEIGRAHV